MITLLLPSKGRPEKAKEAIDCFNRCKTDYSQLILVLNEGDEYNLDVPTIHVPANNMCEAVNLASKYVETENIGFIGDDHHIRTKGFDKILEEKLEENLIVYADDLLQREKLATQCVMRTNVVRTLGYMAIPGLKHLYMDNFWMELGAQFVPEVVIEHMHYLNGKSQHDERYKEVNSDAIHSNDKNVFENWKRTQKINDLRKLNGI